MPAGLANLLVVPSSVERSWTLMPAPGDTTTEYSGDPGSELARSMTPALALELESVWEVTWVLTLPSPVTGSETKRNWSEVPVMSVPAAVTVQVLEFGS